jgi:hypothetical protein
MTIIRSAQLEIIPDMSINMLYRNAKTKIALLLLRYSLPRQFEAQAINYLTMDLWTGANSRHLMTTCTVWAVGTANRETRERRRVMELH